jgi:hypothetical protein
LDVSQIRARIAEPASTARLRALMASVRQRLTDGQGDAMALWEDALPFDGTALAALREAVDDPVALRRQLRAHERRGHRADGSDAAIDAIPGVLRDAVDRPSVASALLWSWLRLPDGDVASQLLQLVRERAGLPPLRRRIAVDDPALAKAGTSGLALVACFADKIVEDGCAWLEHVPPPLPVETSTLAAQAAAVEAARAAAARVSLDEYVPFVRRAASFMVQLSRRGVDPLGFALSAEVQLDVDPAGERRREIAAWALRAGHAIAPRGRLVVLSIAATAPWPLALELIAAEPGRGVGGLALLLRLHGGAAMPVIDRATALLLFPGEPAEERGARFERWLADAYPQAAAAWRPWC